MNVNRTTIGCVQTLISISSLLMLIMFEEWVRRQVSRDEREEQQATIMNDFRKLVANHIL